MKNSQKQNEEIDVPTYMLPNQTKTITIKKLAKSILKNNKKKYDFNNIYIGKSKDKLAINVAYKNKQDCFKTIEVIYKVAPAVL